MSIFLWLPYALWGKTGVTALRFGCFGTEKNYQLLTLDRFVSLWHFTRTGLNGLCTDEAEDSHNTARHKDRSDRSLLTDHTDSV